MGECGCEIPWKANDIIGPFLEHHFSDYRQSNINRLPYSVSSPIVTEYEDNYAQTYHRSFFGM